MSEKISVLDIAVKASGGEEEWDNLSPDRKAERIANARDVIAATGFTPMHPGWFLREDACSGPAKKSFEQFLALVKTGAKSIDIRVTKDGREWVFEGDILKYMRRV
jgi:hypothetical protein